MPIIKSAKKRVKLAAKANARNTRTRRSMREAIKALNTALESGKSVNVAKAQKKAMSAIDTAAKKNVIHKNKAARYKSRIATQAKAAGVKPAKTSSKQKAVANPDVRKAKSGPRPERRGKTAAKKAFPKKSASKL